MAGEGIDVHVTGSVRVVKESMNIPLDIGSGPSDTGPSSFEFEGIEVDLKPDPLRRLKHTVSSALK